MCKGRLQSYGYLNSSSFWVLDADRHRIDWGCPSLRCPNSSRDTEPNPSHILRNFHSNHCQYSCQVPMIDMWLESEL